MERYKSVEKLDDAAFFRKRRDDEKSIEIFRYFDSECISRT